jgi:tRNA(Ile)-lysidine synthase
MAPRAGAVLSMASRARPSPAPVPPAALLARVRRFVVDHDLIRPGTRLLAAVSGGPDSTCLLLVLAALRRSLRFELTAAYFDHRLRGARAAERERNAVRELCAALDVPFRSGAGDVRAHAKSRRLTIEEAARELRYRFLASASGGPKRCAAVAAGHTRDDQAETVLLHLIRGSGLRGLAAMAPSAEWPVTTRSAAPQLVRPLLCLSRKETQRCCRAARVTPMQDPTNRSRSHLRNRVRRDLLPRLRRYNPRIEEALARLAGAAAGDVELLERLAAETLAGAAPKDGAVRIARKRFAELPQALRAHAVRLAFTRLLGDARGLSERHVRAVLRAAAGPSGAQLDLPRGLRVTVERSTIILATEPARALPALPTRQVALPVPGAARLGPWTVRSEVIDRPRSLRSANTCAALLDPDACGRLWLRRRQPGDRFHPLGLPGPKKLQDFLIDAHVPRTERDAIPLVCNKRGIVWVVGQRPAEWAKVSASTRRAVRLRAELA